MKFVLLCVIGFGLTAALAPAAPLPVGSRSDDVGFSEGTAFAGGAYTVLEQRRLSDFSDRVMVLVYFTPW